MNLLTCLPRSLPRERRTGRQGGRPGRKILGGAHVSAPLRFVTIPSDRYVKNTRDATRHVHWLSVLIGTPVEKTHAKNTNGTTPVARSRHELPRRLAAAILDRPFTRPSRGNFTALHARVDSERGNCRMRTMTYFVPH